MADDATIVSSMMMKYESDVPAGLKTDQTALVSAATGIEASNDRLAASSLGTAQAQERVALTAERQALMEAKLMGTGADLALVNDKLAASNIILNDSMATGQGIAAGNVARTAETGLAARLAGGDFLKLADTVHAGGASLKVFDVLGLGLKGNIIALSAVLSFAALKYFADYQLATERAGFAMDLTQKQTKGLGDSIRDLSFGTPTSVTEISKALVLIGGEGLKAADDITIVKEAMDSADITGEELAATAKTLALTLHDFHQPASQAHADISLLTVGSELGQQSVAALGTELGRVGPLAQASHQSLKDTIAALDEISRVTGNPELGATYYASIQQHILAPNKQAVLVMEELKQKTGVDLAKAFSDFASGGENFGQVMTKIKEATHGNVAEVQALFGGYRLAAGALAIVNSSSGEYQGIVTELDKSQQKFNDHLQTTHDNLGYKLGVAANTGKLALIGVGSAINDTIDIASAFGMVEDLPHTAGAQAEIEALKREKTALEDYSRTHKGALEDTANDTEAKRKLADVITQLANAYDKANLAAGKLAQNIDPLNNLKISIPAQVVYSQPTGTQDQAAFSADKKAVSDAQAIVVQDQLDKQKIIQLEGLKRYTALLDSDERTLGQKIALERHINDLMTKADNPNAASDLAAVTTANAQLEEARHQGALLAQDVNLTQEDLAIQQDQNRILQDTYQVQLDIAKQQQLNHSASATPDQKAAAAQTVQKDLNVRIEDQNKLAQDQTLKQVADNTEHQKELENVANVGLEETRHQTVLLSQNLGMSDSARKVAIDSQKILSDTYQLALDTAKYNEIKNDPKATKADKQQALLVLKHDTNIRLEDQGQLAQDKTLDAAIKKFDPLIAAGQAHLDGINRQIQLLATNNQLSTEQKAVRLAQLTLQRDQVQMGIDTNRLLMDIASHASQSQITGDKQKINLDVTTIQVDKADLHLAQNPTMNTQLSNAQADLATDTGLVAQKLYDLHHHIPDHLPSLAKLEQAQDHEAGVVTSLSKSIDEASARIDHSFTGEQAAAQAKLTQATDDLNRKTYDLAHGIKDDLPPLATLETRVSDATDNLNDFNNAAAAATDRLNGLIPGAETKSYLQGNIQIPNLAQIANILPPQYLGGPGGIDAKLSAPPSPFPYADPHAGDETKGAGQIAGLQHLAVLIGQNNEMTASQKTLALDLNQIEQDNWAIAIATWKEMAVDANPASTQAQKDSAHQDVVNAINKKGEDQGKYGNDLANAAILAKFDPLIQAGQKTVDGLDRSIQVEQANGNISSDQKAIDIAQLTLQEDQAQLAIDTNKWLELIAMHADPQQIADALQVIYKDNTKILVDNENVDNAVAQKKLDDLREADEEQIAAIDRSNIILAHQSTMIDLMPGLTQGQRDLQKAQLASQQDANKLAIDQLKLSEIMADPNAKPSAIAQAQNAILTDQLAQETDTAEGVKALREIAVEQLQMQETALDFTKAFDDHQKAMIDLDPNLTSDQKDLAKANLDVQNDQLTMQQDSLKLQEVIAGGGTQADWQRAQLQTARDSYKLQEDQYSVQVKTLAGVLAGNDNASLLALIAVLRGELRQQHLPINRGALGPNSTLRDDFGGSAIISVANGA